MNVFYIFCREKFKKKFAFNHVSSLAAVLGRNITAISEESSEFSSKISISRTVSFTC